MIYFRPKKYGNVSCSVDGKRFDSRREADYYGQLKLEKRGRLIVDFERQVSFDLDVNGKHICRHVVDFLVTLPGGVKEVREVKGFETPEWNLKRKMFEAIYPNIQYRVVR